MPQVEIKDGLGSTTELYEFNGKYFPLFPAIGENLPNLPDMPCRDDDIMLLTYPKAGTHWTWEILRILHTGDGELSSQLDEESMLEFTAIDKITALPSVRLLNTHLTPEFYPKDLIKRKCKIIFVQRNPKDIFASFFHFFRSLHITKYDGAWNGFFELLMAGKNPYGTWFDFIKQWEAFFTQHPDIPVLRLYFEDMKLDLSKEIGKIIQFLDLPCTPSYRDKVAERCGFKSMKDSKKIPKEQLKEMSKDGKDPVYRKGIVGDWKAHFTVAQNERFDAEYKKQMKGFTFKFEQYM